MKKLVALFSLLISSCAITGLSIIDDQIWNIIFYVIGLIAYLIVGALFSVGFLHGKQNGKDAYAFVTFILLFAGYGVYELLVKFKLWVLAWPLAAKIAVPICLFLIAIIVLTLIVVKKKKDNQNNTISAE